MYGKAKWLLLVVLVTLVIASLTGCSQLGLGPRLTSPQVTVLVMYNAVPSIDQYYKEAIGEKEYEASGGIGSATATGKWVSKYTGKGIWKVQGTVNTVKWGDCLTEWTLDERTSKLRLTKFECE